MAKKELRGVIPPMITPFKENGDVDYDAFAFNIEKWNQADVAGYLALGSNSETAYLEEAEKLRLLEITVSTAKKDRFILAGTGLESTRATINLTNKAAKLGAHAALLLTPSYYGNKMTDEALITYFKEVADNAAIPILIYNVTVYTHINISPGAVGELSSHPNILGMKDSSGSIPQLVSFGNTVSPGFNLIVGTASAWYPALTLGIKAGILALANIAPDACTQVQKAFNENRLDEARDLYVKLFPVNAAVTASYGIAGLKYASDLMGYRGGFVRRPLLPLKDEERNKIRDILTRAELL